MSCAGAPWVAPPTSSNPRSTRKEKKNPHPTLACLPSGAGSRVRDSTSTGPRGLRLVLHESMDAAGIDARQAREAREAREGFCQQVGRLTKIYSETSIAISRGADLARAAMLIAAEDESLVSHPSAPLPVDDFIERLDDLSMDFCSLYLPPSSSPPEVFLANLERYIYVHKGFHRTCMMSDARALYLHSVLTCREGSPIMLSLIYSEILKMLRIYGVLDFDVEIYFPHDQVGLPRGYEKQKSRLSDHPHILTSKSFLVEMKMRMLRWMCGYTRKDRTRNKYIRKKGVAPIEDKLRERRLEWFRHINRKPIEAPIRKISHWILPMYREEEGDQKRHDKKL